MSTDQGPPAAAIAGAQVEAWSNPKPEPRSPVLRCRSCLPIERQFMHVNADIKGSYDPVGGEL